MAPPPPRDGAGAGVAPWARWANAVLGAWLFASAFVWPHSGVALTSTWLMGIVIAGLALVATFAPAARWVNTAAGVWVLVAAFFLPARLGTVWNNAIVGGLVVIFSLLPGFQPSRRGSAGA